MRRTAGIAPPALADAVSNSAQASAAAPPAPRPGLTP
jgi:hypothetical protein